MKVLSLSWDNSVLNEDSKLAVRTVEYGTLAGKYDVIVPADKDREVRLSGQAVAYSIASGDRHSLLGRLSGIYKIYRFTFNILKKEKYDAITVQDPFELALIGWLLKIKFKVGLNIQEHGDFFSTKFWRNENAMNFIRYYLGIFLIKKADSIRVVSSRIKKTLSEKLCIDENKIIIVPIFTNIEEKENKLTYAGLREKYRGKFIFLTMGRMVKQKNLSLLIRAFQKVAEKHKEAMLVIVGSGPEKYKIKNLAF
jgi:glycosyltransferase involved in cell wall biosynthesis